MTEKTFSTTTVPPQKSVVDAKLNPEAELHLLVGGPYKDPKGVTHPYGHTALYIRLQGKDYIYDFGRYRDTIAENLGFGIELTGIHSPRGEGILKIWNNFNAYIRSENSYGRTTWGYQYFIFDAQAQRSVDFFNALIEGIKPYDVLPKKNVAFYKLKQDYFALGPNCTTLSLDGAKKAIPKIVDGSEKFIAPEDVLDWSVRKAMEAKYGTPKHLFLPANLKKYLDTAPAVRINGKKTYAASSG